MGHQKRTRGARAVVTGAGSGIGRAFAREPARRHSQVVCADIDLDAATRTVQDIEAAGGRALAVSCDVSSESSVRDLADAATAWFGSPTLVINNAGIGTGGGFIGDGRLKDWQRAMAVNLWGVIYGCDVFAPLLRKNGVGGVINVASAAGFAAAPGMAPYNVSKAGVISLYVLPQREAKIVWLAKRLLPVTYMRAAGRFVKTPQADG